MSGLTLFVATAAITFFLNPSAKKDGNGSFVSPFRTFAKAQNAVRQAMANPKSLSGEIVVKVMDGRHSVMEPVVFGRDDGGTAEHPVRWCAIERGRTRLTGGRDIPILTDVDADVSVKLTPEARQHVRTVDLRTAGIDVTLPGTAVVWGDSFLVPARWPNEGFAGIAAVADLGKDADGRSINPRGFTYADDRVGTWADETDASAVGFFKWDWAADTVKIAKIDPVRRTVEQEGECRHYGYSTQGYWYGVNILREIDRPGEYHISAKTGRLTLWPPNGHPEQTPQVTVSESIFVFKDVRHLQIDGLVLENTREDALRIEGCEDVGIVGCRFENVGRAARTFRSCDVRFVGCDAEHCNFGGFHFERCGVPARLVEAGLLVENCHISDFSRLRPTYTPAVYVFDTCGATVRRNLIHGGPHVGILFRGRMIRIENNEIHSVCLESGEMGAVYAGRDWTLCGDVISGNYIHDIGIGEKALRPNRAVMLDDGAAGVSVCSNRFIRVAEGVCLSSIGNRVERNLFVENYPAISGWGLWSDPAQFHDKNYTSPSVLERFRAVPSDEDPWKTRFPYLELIRKAMSSSAPRTQELNTVIRGNAIVGGPDEAFFYSHKKYVGIDFWTVEGNVRSVDGSVAEVFLPSLSEVGLYASAERATWPVTTQVEGRHVERMTNYQKNNYRPMK